MPRPQLLAPIVAIVTLALLNVAWLSGLPGRDPRPPVVRLQPSSRPAAVTSRLTADSPAPGGAVDDGLPEEDEYPAGYDPDRPGRACVRLARNVTVRLGTEFSPGIERELQMLPSARRYWTESMASSSTSMAAARRAFVLVVTNHRYVDGAVAMAASLRNTSSMVRRGEVEVAVLTTAELHEEALQVLATVCDRVFVLRSLGRFAPKSAYKFTFDKAYLFYLTQYERVMFLDADHLVYDATGIEKLWTAKPLTRPAELLAVGGKDYFQTALMVIQPNRDIFMDVYLEYRFGTFGYNQWRARDGILLRNCFLSSVVGVSHPKGLHHFYGYSKPWFNREKPERKHPNYYLTYDSHYRAWWRTYEEVHTRLLVPLEKQRGAWGKGAEQYGEGTWRNDLTKRFIAASARRRGGGKHVLPTEFMWLLRHARDAQYLAPTQATLRRMAEQRFPQQQVLQAREPSQSCDDVCGDAGLSCRQEGLLFASVNSEEALRSAVGGQVAVCDEQDSLQWLPVVGRSRVGAKDTHSSHRLSSCIRSGGQDPRVRPQCNATPVAKAEGNVEYLRRCLCVPAAVLHSKPKAAWESS